VAGGGGEVAPNDFSIQFAKIALHEAPHMFALQAVDVVEWREVAVKVHYYS